MAEGAAEAIQPKFPTIGERQRQGPKTDVPTKEALLTQPYPIRFEPYLPTPPEDKAKIEAAFEQGTVPYAHMVADAANVSERLQGNKTKVVFLPPNPNLPEKPNEPPTSKNLWLGLSGGPEDILDYEHDPDKRLLVVTSNPLGAEAIAENSKLTELQKKLNEQIADDNEGWNYNVDTGTLALFSIGLTAAATFQKDHNTYKIPFLHRYMKRRTVLGTGATLLGAAAVASIFGKNIAPSIASRSDTNSPVLAEAAKWLGPKLADLPARKFMTAMSVLISKDAHDVMVQKGLPATAPLGIMGDGKQFSGAEDLVTDEKQCAQIVHDYVHGLGNIMNDVTENGKPLTAEQKKAAMESIKGYLASFYISQVAEPASLKDQQGNKTFPDAVQDAIQTFGLPNLSNPKQPPTPFLSERVIKAIGI